MKSKSCASKNSNRDYDIHGNVKELVQEDSTLRALDDVANSRYQSYKTFEYSYDLVSGNVNMLAYQHGQADAFYYRYAYDADNRVTAAYTHAGPLVTRQSKGSSGSGGSAGPVTSSAVEMWDRDAKYFYYQHGPLARTEIGQNKVQASDYAYTLHGWIKGVNSNLLTAAKDMGEDGITTGLNKYIGVDQYGYQLTYYDSTGKKDYTSITTNAAFASQNGSSLAGSSNNLWNGNIKNMVTSIAPFLVTGSGRPQARAFTYDQLNRIKVAQVDTAMIVASNAWSTGGNINQWKETFIYDHNGNIKTLVRHGKSPTTMDSLTYNYNSGRNQLNYVDDVVNSANYTTDIDDQSANNYIYDSIGNLTKDVSEEIDSIIWNVYGKIERVVRTASSERSDLEFRYDAMGNRICKIVKPRDGAGIVDQDGWTYTYYLRDASGNVIAVYDRDYSTPGATYTDEFSLKEDHLYGSSRVGIRTIDEVVCTTTYTYGSTGSNGVFTGTFSSRTATAASTTNYNHELKRKAFELSNHLGNVLVTVSDARTATNSSGTVSAFTAVLESAQDYYAFGSPMAGRTYTSSTYRYAFNGKEKDNELTEGSLDFGARVYESRLGRWYKIDPLAGGYASVSPYSYGLNNPVLLKDPDGNKILVYYLNEQGEKVPYVYKPGIAPLTNNDNVNKFYKAMEYMHQNDPTGQVNEMVTSDYTTEVRFSTSMDDVNYSNYVRDANTGEIVPGQTYIVWNPDIAMATIPGDSKITQPSGDTYTQGAVSPSTILFHEIVHCNRMNADPTGTINDHNTPDPFYDNAEDKRVIENYERQYIAAVNANEQNKANMSGSGGKAQQQGERWNHSGLFFQCAGVNSIAPVETRQDGIILIKAHLADGSTPYVKFKILGIAQPGKTGLDNTSDPSGGARNNQQIQIRVNEIPRRN